MLTTLEPCYFLGVDAGGTKTEAVISNESGFILGKSSIFNGANPHNTSYEEVYKTIEAAIRSAAENAREKHPDHDPSYFAASFIGMAGYDTPDDKRRLVDFLATRDQNEVMFKAEKSLAVANNGFISLRAGSEQNWGVCIRAGAGSSCYGLAKSGKEAVAGGWGFALGDQFSGYAIGRALLRQVMREYDGRVPKTRITKAILEKLQLEAPEQLVDWVYKQEKVPIHDIAQLSTLCNDVSLSDSIEIADIINTSIHQLSAAYSAVNRRLQFPEDQTIPVVLVGDLFTIKGQYSEKAIRSILNITPNANVVFPSKSPAEGAIALAQIMGQAHVFPNSVLEVINPAKRV